MMARRILKEGLPAGTYLNLNVPKVETVKGIKVCRQAAGKWVKEYKRSENGAGKPVFWLTGSLRMPNRSIRHDTLALDSGIRSTVPVNWMLQTMAGYKNHYNMPM